MHSSKLALIGLCGAASLGLGSLAVEAAPLAATGREAMAAVGGNLQAQPIAYRRCWWQGGSRHCRYGSPYRGYGYRYDGPLYPEAYRTGSSRWWQEMDREDRGGRGRNN
jgi:hypothetical protein